MSSVTMDTAPLMTDQAPPDILMMSDDAAAEKKAGSDVTTAPPQAPPPTAEGVAMQHGPLAGNQGGELASRGSRDSAEITPQAPTSGGISELLSTPSQESGQVKSLEIAPCKSPSYFIGLNRPMISRNVRKGQRREVGVHLTHHQQQRHQVLNQTLALGHVHLTESKQKHISISWIDIIAYIIFDSLFLSVTQLCLEWVGPHRIRLPNEYKLVVKT